MEEAKNKYLSLENIISEKNQELILRQCQHEAEISEAQKKFALEIAEKNKKALIYYFLNIHI